MFYKKLSLIILIALFTVLSPFSSYSDEIETEVIITVKESNILAFSANKNHWVRISMGFDEEVIKKKTKGNIGIVVTTERILGFSVMTDQWTIEDFNTKEKLEEIVVKGNVATVTTNERVIGFSAHTGQFIDAP